MFGRSLHKLATWLCLVATLLMGISPGQAGVLCLEPDGAISFELADDGASKCGGCPEGSGESREAARPLSEAADCSCIDIPLVLGSDEDRVELKQVDLPVALSATLPVLVVHTIVSAPLMFGARPVPRPAQSLTLIRSVVLLV
jgi:hypothetical protein